MEHKLPELGYGYDALEPFIDSSTMEIHHTKHHQGYVDKLNKALEDHKELQGKSVQELISGLDKVPEAIREAVRNNGGGHLNHSFFWPLLKKGVEPGGDILTAIEDSFGSFDSFRERFSGAAATLFGSGWVWLMHNGKGLEITATHNQDSPLSMGFSPVLALDMWEHAYYLKYQNRKQEYIKAFFSVVDWEQAGRNLAEAARA